MTESSSETALVGQGDFVYEPLVDWAQLPDGWCFNEVVAVEVDSHDRVFVVFQRPHGLIIGQNDEVFCTDDFGHAVYKFSLDGELLMSLGTAGIPSNTGVERRDYRTIQQAAAPFNLPTNVALSPAGEIYVSDGYGNAKIHKFSPDGQFIKSWGEPGSAPSKFHVPHGVTVDADGNVFVCDRENTRIQIFSSEGEFLDEWTHVARPCQVVFDENNNAYVAELGFLAGRYLDSEFPGREPIPSRVGIYNRDGDQLSVWGSGEYGKPGEFFAAHGIAVDSHGDLYVGEVRPGGVGYDQDPPIASCAPPNAPVLQKFVRSKPG